MRRVPPPPPPRRVVAPSPTELYSAAVAVLGNDEPVLAGRRAVTSAALARQAIESAVDRWLLAQGINGCDNRRQGFACLAALYPDLKLARQLHNVWARLSDACHAVSYDMPPTTSELEGWFEVVHRFVTSADSVAMGRSQQERAASGGTDAQNP